MEYIIYCDESEKRGKHFSNFYGGCLVNSQNFEKIKDELNQHKSILNFNSEIKWQKVSANYLDKYKSMMDLFFDFIQQDKIKVRIMFTQNFYQAKNLTEEQKDNEYHILYYQFLKNVFGLRYSNNTADDILIRVYLDELPDSADRNKKLKDYIASLNVFPPFQEAKIRFCRQQIAEVDSAKHVLMQCIDIVLGAMQFRLNDLHKEKPEGATRRGKRTIAKEKLYKHIYSKIQDMYPKFNIGMNTSIKGDYANRWNHRYRHWLFIPTDYTPKQEYTKNRQKK